MSTSRNWALFAPDIQNRFAPDELRYYLAASAPESRDSNWSWKEFVRRNNDELVATWGNLANRVLSLTYKEFKAIPEPLESKAADLELISAGQSAFETVGTHLDSVRLKAALQELMALAQRGNLYITEQQPWKLLKTDRPRAQAVLYTGLQLIEYLKTLLSPFLPFTSQALHETLGWSGTLSPFPELASAIDPDGQPRKILTGRYQTDCTWEPRRLPVGQALREPTPLFAKYDDALAHAEIDRLGAGGIGG